MIKRYHVSLNLIPEVRSANGWIIGYRRQNTGEYVESNPQGEWLSPKISMSPGQIFTISAMNVNDNSMSVYFWNGDTFLGAQSRYDYSGSTFTAIDNTTHIDFAIRASAANKTEAAIISSGFWVMLNLGSTALPYEPYSTDVWHEIPLKVYDSSGDTWTESTAKKYSNGSWGQVTSNAKVLRRKKSAKSKT